MVLHDEKQQTGIDHGDTAACLTGETTDGVEVAEFNEANNARALPAGCGPDLSISGAYDGNDGEPAECYVDVDIVNRGTYRAGVFSVQVVHVDGSVRGPRRVDALAAGATVTLRFYGVSGLGWTAVVVSGDEVKESNEANNERYLLADCGNN
jgi:hypothetical protein